MVNQGDDDSFLEDFLARAKERQAKLAKITKQIESHSSTSGTSGNISSIGNNNNNKASINNAEVSYPPLSPLEEGDDDSNAGKSVSPDDEDDEEISYNAENKRNDFAQADLNYSSDLSLECEDNNGNDTGDKISDIYRARPVYASSSPEQVPRQYHHPNSPTKSIPFSQISPRKRVAPMNPREFQQQPQAQLSTQHQQQHEQPSTAPLQERQQEQKATSSQSLPETSATEQTIRSLQIKLERAEQTRTQLKKAVEASKYGSQEHIEAARLLQIAEIEHLNYTNYVAMFRQGLRKKTESLGTIKISSIRLKLSSKMRNDLAEDGVHHYFFCIASCATEVKATELMDTNDIRRQDLKTYLQFKEKISFVELPPDFVVKVEVFELVTSQPLPKLLLRLTPSKKTKIAPDTHFRRVGSLKLTLSDREVSYKNLVQWSKHEESKYLERECKFVMELKPEQLPTKSGMLHVRCLDSGGRPDWARYFVELSDGLIRFWKSKQDALDERKPNQVFEFKDLCAERVQKLTPDDDLYRQNSFVLYTYQQVAGGDKETLFQRVLADDPKFKIVKHQLAADNKDEKDSWCQILDKSMNCFREWHGKTRIYTIDEIKEIFSSSY